MNNGKTFMAGAVVYVVIAFNTWAYNYHRGWCAEIHHNAYSDGRIGCSGITGLVWPLYWPARLIFKAYQP